MKHIVLLLIISLLISCNNTEADKRVYYRDLETGIILDELDYQDAKNQKEEEAKMSFLILEEMLEDSLVKQDSIIRDYSFIYNIDKEALAVKKKTSAQNLIGHSLEPFNLMTINSNVISTAMSNGKPTLINIWFIACKPCVAEIPMLNNIADKYSERLNFISLTFDSEEKVEAFMKQTAFNFTAVSDGNDLIELLGIVSFPKSLLIDENGVIIHIKENHPEELIPLIDQLYS